MENWLSIEGLVRGMRNSFLINRKPTQIEIYRIKDLFKQIMETTATIQTLSDRLKSFSCNASTTYQIQEEAIRLLVIYGSLEKMVRANEHLQERFIFDIAKAKTQIEDILAKTLSPGNRL